MVNNNTKYRTIYTVKHKLSKGLSGGAKVLGKLSVPGWIKVAQGPTALAAGVGGDCLDIFSSPVLSIFSPSLGDGLK